MFNNAWPKFDRNDLKKKVAILKSLGFAEVDTSNNIDDLLFDQVYYKLGFSYTFTHQEWVNGNIVGYTKEYWLNVEGDEVPFIEVFEKFSEEDSEIILFHLDLF